MGCAVLRSLASGSEGSEGAEGGASMMTLRLATRTQETLDAYVAYGVESFLAPGQTGASMVGADIVVLAVKPKVATTLLASTIGPSLAPGQIVLSLAAGVSLATMQALVPEGVHVVRSMPSTPMAIGEGVLSLCADSALPGAEEALATVQAVFADAAGSVVVLPESQMDAATALAGSGPAYIFAFAEAFLDAASAVGIDDPNVARALVGDTLKGAVAYLLSQPDMPAARLRQEVTSPNGTTAAALGVLADRDWHTAFVAAIQAASSRSAEIGAQLNAASSSAGES